MDSGEMQVGRVTIKYRVNPFTCWIMDYPARKSSGSVQSKYTKKVYEAEHGITEVGSRLVHDCGDRRCIRPSHIKEVGKYDSCRTKIDKWNKEDEAERRQERVDRIMGRNGES